MRLTKWVKSSILSLRSRVSRTESSLLEATRRTNQFMPGVTSGSSSGEVSCWNGRRAVLNVDSQHGFARPTAPVVREVEIPDSIAVAELAQRMAVKANEVIKVLFNMGAMVTINQVLENSHIYRALLTARTKHEPTREMWDEGRAVLAAPIAEFIRSERVAGRAPDGADAEQLADGLVAINESVLERVVHAPDQPRDTLLATAADMWVRAVYGRPDPAVDAADPGRN